MVTVSLRFDEAIKQELDRMCEEMGMNLTTFFMIYARAALRERKIPFEVRASDDLFYSKANHAAILHSDAERQSGNVIPKTISELENMAR